MPYLQFGERGNQLNECRRQKDISVYEKETTFNAVVQMFSDYKFIKT